MGYRRGPGTLAAMDLDTAAEPTPEPAADPAPTRAGRRWPLGLLTLIFVGLVAGGAALLGGTEGDAADTSLPSLGPIPTVAGDTAPDFEVDLIDGTPFRLSTHLEEDGRPVVLNLWASWCTPCRAEMPALDAAATAHPEVLFLGVAVEDDPTAAAGFAAEIAVSYPLAIDEAERVARRYPSPGLPATYFISTDGLIVKTVFGRLDEAQLDSLLETAFGP